MGYVKEVSEVEVPEKQGGEGVGDEESGRSPPAEAC